VKCPDYSCSQIMRCADFSDCEIRPGGRIRGHLVHGLGGTYRPADVNTPHTAHRGSSGRQGLNDRPHLLVKTHEGRDLYK